MSKFLTNLRIELNDLYPEIGNWMVISPLTYYSHSIERVITVPVMFPTDLATIPRIFYPFINTADSYIAAPSVIHDYLYKSMKFPRETCDFILYEAMLEAKSTKIKAKIVYLAVRLFGKYYYGR